MSPHHRTRQIDNGSVNRLRDRWRPPDQKRERRPAGTEAANLENNLGNRSSSPDGPARHSLQELALEGAQSQNGATPRRPTQKWRGNSAVQKRGRRHRLISDALRKHDLGAVALLLGRLEEDFGDDLRVDVRLEHMIDADPRAIALLGAAR